MGVMTPTDMTATTTSDVVVVVKTRRPKQEECLDEDVQNQEWGAFTTTTGDNGLCAVPSVCVCMEMMGSGWTDGRAKCFRLWRVCQLRRSAGGGNDDDDEPPLIKAAASGRDMR